MLGFRYFSVTLCERDSSIAVQIAIASILLGELTEKNYPIIEEEQRKLISEIRERFSNLESKRIYAVAHYLDPRFKDQFVPNRLEFVSKIHSWIKRTFCCQPIVEKWKADLQPLDSDPFNYWKENEKMFPILSPIVRRYLSAQATSVETSRFVDDCCCASAQRFIGSITVAQWGIMGAMLMRMGGAWAGPARSASSHFSFKSLPPLRREDMTDPFNAPFVPEHRRHLLLLLLVLLMLVVLLGMQEFIVVNEAGARVSGINLSEKCGRDCCSEVWTCEWIRDCFDSAYVDSDSDIRRKAFVEKELCRSEEQTVRMGREKGGGRVRVPVIEKMNTTVICFELRDLEALGGDRTEATGDRQVEARGDSIPHSSSLQQAFISSKRFNNIHESIDMARAIGKVLMIGGGGRGEDGQKGGAESGDGPERRERDGSFFGEERTDSCRSESAAIAFAPPRIPPSGRKFRAAKFGPQVSGCKIRAASFGLQNSGRKFRGRKIRAASFALPFK
uniref:HAT C-terminal dimerisation domain-containing protein n=1 Tax=Globodera rostochiensis TaxID=31243 RepID=A0A914HQX0_GLORO